MLFYTYTSSGINLVVADDEELTVDELLVNRVARSILHVLYRRYGWVIQDFDWQIVGVDSIYIQNNVSIYLLHSHLSCY